MYNSGQNYFLAINAYFVLHVCKIIKQILFFSSYKYEYHLFYFLRRFTNLVQKVFTSFICNNIEI